MRKTVYQWAAAIAAAALLTFPGPILLALFPAFFHLHVWRLLAAYLLTLPATIPILFLAQRYFHGGSFRSPRARR